MRKELNSQRIFLVHQHGRRFIVLEHQYGRRDVMWKRFIWRGLLWDDPCANEQTCKQWRQQGFALGLSPCPRVSGYFFKKEGACLRSSWGWGRSPPEFLRETFIFMSFILLIFLQVLETFLYLRINQLDIQSLKHNDEKKTAVELKIEKNKNRIEKKLKGKMSKKEKKVCQPTLYCIGNM